MQPDLWCFGKVIGGGLPVGAFGGRADVLASLAPHGPVYQAGTLSGNPLATAAGLAVLEELDASAYERLSGRVRQVRPGAGGAAHRHPRQGGRRRPPRSPARSPGAGGRPLFGLSFVPVGTGPVTDYDGATASASTGLYGRLFAAMLDRGVALAPGPYEVAFPSMAHGDAELDRTLDVAAEAMMAALGG